MRGNLNTTPMKQQQAGNFHKQPLYSFSSDNCAASDLSFKELPNNTPTHTVYEKAKNLILKLSLNFKTEF